MEELKRIANNIGLIPNIGKGGCGIGAYAIGKVAEVLGISNIKYMYLYEDEDWSYMSNLFFQQENVCLRTPPCHIVVVIDDVIVDPVRYKQLKTTKDLQSKKLMSFIVDIDNLILTINKPKVHKKIAHWFIEPKQLWNIDFDRNIGIKKVHSVINDKYKQLHQDICIL